MAVFVRNIEPWFGLFSDKSLGWLGEQLSFPFLQQLSHRLRDCDYWMASSKLVPSGFVAIAVWALALTVAVMEPIVATLVNDRFLNYRAGESCRNS